MVLSNDLNLMTRDMWLAKPPKSEIPLTSPVSRVFLINSKKPCWGLDSCLSTMYDIQQYYLIKMADIRHNFLISNDGTVYEGRGWQVQPNLNQSNVAFNCCSLLIGYMGEYLGDAAPQVMTDTLKRLVDYGIKSNYINPMFLFHDIRLDEPWKNTTLYKKWYELQRNTPYIGQYPV